MVQRTLPPGASETLERDWERMVTFHDFPREHWQHLRTTNPLESPFAALRLRTDAAKRYKRVDRAMAVIWKMLLVAAGKRGFEWVKWVDRIDANEGPSWLQPPLPLR
jgi:transposase-like protein